MGVYHLRRLVDQRDDQEPGAEHRQDPLERDAADRGGRREPEEPLARRQPHGYLHGAVRLTGEVPLHALEHGLHLPVHATGPRAHQPRHD